MSLAKRLEALETTLARQSGGGYRVVICRYGEREDDVLERAGLSDWNGLTIFIRRFGPPVGELPQCD